MRKILMKYSEYISVIGFFFINSILVGLFKCNWLILNLIYIVALCVERYILYLPIDKSVNNSFKTCSFDDSINLINEYLPFMNKQRKDIYIFDLLLFKNLINPTKKGIIEYIELLNNSFNSFNKIGNTSEMYFNCLLIKDIENANILFDKLMLLIENKKTYTNLFRKERLIVLKSIYNKDINEDENGIFKCYVPYFDTDNEYQKIKTKYLLGVYYSKRKNFKESNENFEYVLKHGNNIYLKKLTIEYIEKNKIN